MESLLRLQFTVLIDKYQEKETQNFSKIWPLNFDFPEDFLKFWKI